MAKKVKYAKWENPRIVALVEKDFALRSNSEEIELIHEKYSDRDPREGVQMRLPDTGQIFTFVRILHWNYASRPRQKSWEFESNCQICGAPYRFNVPSYFKHLVRTCPQHRWQFRSPQARAAPKPIAIPDGRRGPGQSQWAVIYAHEALDVAGLPITEQAIVQLVMADNKNPRLRKTHVQRAYRTLQSRGLL